MTVTARTCTESTLVEISSGHALWWADLDMSNGGSGLHPNPHDLLDSALASCTVLTLQLYAARKDYPLEGVQTQVDRTHDGALYQLNRRIELSGALTQDQRQDLLRVANACPIHKALSGRFVIATDLV